MLLSLPSNEHNSLFIYGIIIVSVVLSSTYLPFQQVFAWNNEPLKQTKFIALFFALNVLLNILLIPKFNLYGAAIGTSVSLLIQVPIFAYAFKKTYST